MSLTLRSSMSDDQQSSAVVSLSSIRWRVDSPKTH